MSKKLKQWMAGEIETRLADAENCVVFGYASLPAETSAVLRGKLRDASVSMMVLRNRVAAKALAGSRLEPLESLFKGPTAIVHGGDDAVSLAKAIVEGVKGEKGFDFRGGLIEGQVVDGDAIEQLAKLPSKDDLLSMIASAVAAPITNIAYGVDGILIGVARAVDALREQKEQEAQAA